ncbi:rhodanese-like domain-containing protein [Malonomonas rubra]|uniref:rhodanese-like domain-containing protein n=1 Tax=Malonomonas rubra TaxID=57040 RepID=UPI0026F31FDF|nr:rhodanese-like domain-containing protein [Malonomonas rubra]
MSDLSLSPTLKRILLEACILVTVAFAVGLSINYQMVLNAFSGKTVSAAPVQKTTQTKVVEELLPNPVEIGEIDEMVAEGAMLIDARNIADYKAGHIKGAISLPIGEAETKLESFRQQVPKEQTLILYCNGFGCHDSFDLGVFLLKVGYQDVLVYEGGFPEWRDQGRAIEEGLQ